MTKAIALEPEKLQIIVMVIAYLHNFLRKSQSSRNLYISNGTCAYETHNNLVPGWWRGEHDIVNEMVPFHNIPQRCFEDVKLGTDELAD